MSSIDDRSADALRFYTHYRYEGTPQQVVHDFCDALPKLLDRLRSDLRSTAKGDFGWAPNDEKEAMAVAVDRSLGHVEVFRGLALGAGMPAGSAPIMTILVANVLTDANATGTALARANAPRAHEAKFDCSETGSEVEGMKEYADKIKDAAEGIGKLLGIPQIEGVGELVAAVPEDIAICGAKPAKHSGGNEATRQIEEKLDAQRPVAGGIKESVDDATERITMSTA